MLETLDNERSDFLKTSSRIKNSKKKKKRSLPQALRNLSILNVSRWDLKERAALPGRHFGRH